MSGWDTSSRPLWDPQDGPADSTQAFPAPDTAAPAGDGWGVQASPSGGPPPEFFQPDYAPQDAGRQAPPSGLAQRNPGRHAARHSAPGLADAAPAAPAAPASPGFPDPGFGSSGAAANGFNDSGFSGSSPGGSGFGGSGLASNGFGESGQGNTGPQQTARQDPPWGDFAAPDFAAPDLTRREPSRTDFTAQEPTRRDSARPDFGAPELARGGSAGPGAPTQRDRGQQPAGPLSPADRIDGYLAQRGRGTHGGPVADRPDRDMAARMDPALKDFFDPTTARPGTFPGVDRGPAADPAYRPAGGLPRSAQSPQPGQPPQAAGPRSWDAQVPGRPGQPGQLGPARPWDAPPPARPAGGPGAPGSRTARRLAEEDAPGRGRTKVLVAVLVIVVLAVAGYLWMNKPGGTNSAANNTQPTVSTSTSAPTTKTSKPAASQPPSKPAGTVYALSAPATAGGYPQGQDPHFLAAASTTADAVRSAAVHGGATVTGSPVSAAYQLPTFNQVMTFVGYQGTFNPATVMASLATLGATDVNKYGTGPHGGQFACATAPSTPAATVCVWVTTSTLGVAEFFSSTGPEVLTTHQDHGAAYALKLRDSVETKKS